MFSVYCTIRGVSYYDAATVWIRPLDVKLEESLILQIVRLKTRISQLYSNDAVASYNDADSLISQTVNKLVGQYTQAILTQLGNIGNSSSAGSNVLIMAEHAERYKLILPNATQRLYNALQHYCSIV
jgi:hypothetical protein